MFHWPVFWGEDILPRKSQLPCMASIGNCCACRNWLPGLNCDEGNHHPCWASQDTGICYITSISWLVVNNELILHIGSSGFLYFFEIANWPKGTWCFIHPFFAGEYGTPAINHLVYNRVVYNCSWVQYWNGESWMMNECSWSWWMMNDE